MTDDDLNALLAAWAKEDGSADTGNEIGSSTSDTFSALTSGGSMLDKWQSKWQGGGQSGGGGGWQNQQKKEGGGWQSGGGKAGGGWSGGKAKMSPAQKIANGDPIYWGRVKTYDKEKNRGYIACEEICTMCGMDVYVYGDVLSQSNAAPGDSVAFFCHWSQAGQPQASAPMLRIAEAAEAGGFAMKGAFKQGPGGAGFIENEFIKEFFGSDVYVNKELTHDLQVGQTVAFNCFLNEEKTPAAEALEACPPEWEPTAGDLSCTRTDHSIQSGAVKGGCKGASKGGGKAAGGASWGDSGKGGGEGGDGWGKGMGKGKGAGKMAMMMAVLEMLDGGWGDWGDSWDGGWDGGGKGKDAAKGGKGAWGSSGKSAGKGGGGGGGGIPEGTGDTFYGVIKSFNEKSNYGFVASEQIQEKYNGVDCFFHGKLIGDLTVGDMVEFDVGLNTKGQPQCLTLRPLSMPGEEGEPPSKMAKLG